MRFRTLILWVVVLGLLAWGGYTIVWASSSYLQASGMVEQVVQEAANRRKAAVAVGMPGANSEFIVNVRAGVTAAARRSGLLLDEGGLVVSEIPGGVRVSVKWSLPALSFQGETLLSIPMSLNGTFSTN